MPAGAAETSQTFVAPTLKNVRLDWCRNWGRECGGPAAELFCRAKGFNKATSWSIDPNAGARGIPTLVFGDGRLCKAPECSAFRSIVCSRTSVAMPEHDAIPDAQEQKVKPAVPALPAMTMIKLGPGFARFDRPQIKRVLLDWCKHWRRDCGRPAADLFCREQGFDRASKFSADKTGIRGRRTIVFGDGRICEGPRCQAFRSITCAEPPQTQEQAAELKPPEEPADITKKPATVVNQKTSAFTFTKLSSFKPLRPREVRLGWIKTLRVLNAYPAGASLYKCGSGDCSVATSADFRIDEKTPSPGVDLAYDVSNVPHAEGVLWQVSYLPFPPFARANAADLAPPGLVLSGYLNFRQSWLSFGAAEAAKKLPPGAKEAIFHIRVLPVAAQANIVGQPSNVMRAYYGLQLPPQEPYKIYAKSEVPGSAPKIRLVKFGFEPFKSVDRWPPGCSTWEEVYGEDKTIFEEIGDFFSGAWNWASDAYQWAKDQVIELASVLTFDLIPKDVFVFALDTAMVSMGIPPDIPNLDQLMKEGVDGLAKEMAKAAVTQIPAADLAANVGNLAADVSLSAAASMTEEALRKRLEQEIEKHSREAISAAAEEMQRQLAQSGEGKLCTGADFHPVFKVTVANAGDKDYDNVQIRAGANPVYRGGNWTLSLRRGEQLTLVGVGEPILPGGPYSAPLLTEKQRHDEDVERWYRDILFQKKAILSVDATGALICLGGDPSSAFCDRELVNLHRSAPQLVTSAYSVSR
jgi:hypothetical protein